MPQRSTLTEQDIWTILAQVTDPEVPVLTILDLGIVRNVKLSQETDQSTNQSISRATVVITPTYSGCPAMDVIGMQIRMALAVRDLDQINIELQLSPAWTTDWMSDEGRRKLKEYGIAPPQYAARKPKALFEEEEVPCPNCDSTDTRLVSGFGATSCKALYQCNSCKEPFEHFKCH